MMPDAPALIPVYRALTIVGNVLRIDRKGVAHVPFRSDTTIGEPVEVVFILLPSAAEEGG